MATITKQGPNAYRITFTDTETNIVDRALLEVPDGLQRLVEQFLQDFTIKFQDDDEEALTTAFAKLSPADKKFIRDEIKARASQRRGQP